MILPTPGCGRPPPPGIQPTEHHRQNCARKINQRDLSTGRNLSTAPAVFAENCQSPCIDWIPGAGGRQPHVIRGTGGNRRHAGPSADHQYCHCPQPTVSPSTTCLTAAHCLNRCPLSHRRPRCLTAGLSTDHAVSPRTAGLSTALVDFAENCRSLGYAGFRGPEARSP